MSGLKTLAYLLITFTAFSTGLVALVISQPAQLLCQVYALMQTAIHSLY
jgi:hypothetical protein